MKNKTEAIWTILLIGILGLGVVGYAAANTLTGREIIENVDAMETADDATLLMTMTLINDRDESLVREMRSWKQGTENTALLFIAPEDVAGTAFLTIQTDGDDDMWLYLPSLELTKRIDADSKSQSFMGSDFTYDDMGERDIDDYTYTFIREDVYEGQPVLVVEGVAVDPEDAGYSKVISWIRDDIWMPMKIEYFDVRGDLEKVQTNIRIEQIGGYWAITKMDMENVQTNHKTIVEMTQVELNTGIPSEVFTSEALPTLPDRVP
jgi:outer membrane lipoprotein-sorting protein